MGIIGESFTWRGNSSYTYCTGFEGVKGVCWWCGRPHDKKTQCCSHEHKQQYLRHFDWRDASEWALERVGCCRKGYKYGWIWTDAVCQECGLIFRRNKVEVHHIISLMGGKRFYSVLNCPCLLLVLCIECHGKKRRKPIVPIEELPLFRGTI